MSQSAKVSKTLLGLLCFTIFSGAAYYSRNSEYVYAYRMHVLANDTLDLNFETLAPISDQDLRSKYSIDWYCEENLSQFGDAFCADELKEWNEIPALNTLFWFQNHRLSNARINVPPWAHDELIRYLVRTHGQPVDYSTRTSIRSLISLVQAINEGIPANRLEEAIGDLGIWHLNSGAWLVVNLKKENNPFRWSQVLWMGPDRVKQILDTANEVE